MSKYWEIKNEIFEFDKSKNDLISNLDYIASMDVEEQTLYKKWIELNEDLHSSMKNLPVIQSYYDLLWKPKDIMNYDLTINEINSLQPYVEILEETDEVKKWSAVRRMVCTMEFTANPGRNIKAFIKDRVSDKILGVIALGSDVASLKSRDEYIGWNREDKFQNGKLRCLGMGTSITPTQPFGYNFLGGKLVAALTTSPVFRNKWKEKYNDIMIGMTTTSLYGGFSQYNGMSHYKKLGETAGMISIKPDDKYYDVWHQYIKLTYPDKYQKAISTTGPKQNVLNLIFKEIGIKQGHYNHGFKRGVYFAQMYENGNDYLCNRIDESKLKMKDIFSKGDEYSIQWWKEKAIKRYTNLHSENRLKNETLFYSDIIGMTWEQCKEKYLSQVGR